MLSKCAALQSPVINNHEWQFSAHARKRAGNKRNNGRELKTASSVDEKIEQARIGEKINLGYTQLPSISGKNKFMRPNRERARTNAPSALRKRTRPHERHLGCSTRPNASGLAEKIPRCPKCGRARTNATSESPSAQNASGLARTPVFRMRASALERHPGKLTPPECERSFTNATSSEGCKRNGCLTLAYAGGYPQDAPRNATPRNPCELLSRLPGTSHPIFHPICLCSKSK